jgi:hypothetical protein
LKQAEVKVEVSDDSTCFNKPEFSKKPAVPQKRLTVHFLYQSWNCVRMGGHEETWGRLTAALSCPVYCVGWSALVLTFPTAQYVIQAIS